ncbi:uncharacterized protein TNIN_480671 [Trichonephila inaurata madagascariensis]|uniref:Uncharacterized protein n=1 Tax=Trichonephila inaurata madagascariensis TaxID=2747483 RepID=A0A8X6WZM0_9ARAC|nr:uncharacterized protein TNIN_480671 [Trichonephila inaurata madagascariensis]
MKLFWRFTTALTCATALSPGFLFKPAIPMRPERRAALARKLKKLIDDYEGTNAPKLCKNLNLPLKELLKWLEKSKVPTTGNKCHDFQHIMANNDYFSWKFLVGLRNVIRVIWCNKDN